MKTDDFEKRLQQVAPRDIPPDWREDILRTALRAANPSQSTPAANAGWLATLIHQLSTVGRPQRAAWAGLAALWVVILAMNFAARGDKSVATTSATLPTPETLLALRHQKSLLLTELTGQSTTHVADRPKLAPTGPRSQRHVEIVTV